jgi:hypothetical protein
MTGTLQNSRGGSQQVEQPYTIKARVENFHQLYQD